MSDETRSAASKPGPGNPAPSPMGRPASEAAGTGASSAAIDVEFVESLPECRSDKWRHVRATLAGRAGEWAKIDAKGGYPKSRLVELGCEVRVIGGVLYARWPS